LGRAAPTSTPLSRLLLSIPKPNTRRPAAMTWPPPRTPVLRRREAVLSRVLPTGAEAASGECPLEVTPSGLGFCDRVVGTDAAGPAHHGQCVYIYICFNPVSRRPGSFLIPMGECRRTTPGGWRTARCSTAATSAGSRSPSASASARYIHRHRMIRVHRKFSLRSARPACIPVLI
jgi:hypothetical protein